MKVERQRAIISSSIRMEKELRMFQFRVTRVYTKCTVGRKNKNVAERSLADSFAAYKLLDAR